MSSTQDLFCHRRTWRFNYLHVSTIEELRCSYEIPDVTTIQSTVIDHTDGIDSANHFACVIWKPKVSAKPNVSLCFAEQNLPKCPTHTLATTSTTDVECLATISLYAKPTRCDMAIEDNTIWTITLTQCHIE